MKLVVERLRNRLGIDDFLDSDEIVIEVRPRLRHNEKVIQVQVDDYLILIPQAALRGLLSEDE